MARNGRGCLTPARVALPLFRALIGRRWAGSPYKSLVHANHCDSGWKLGAISCRFESLRGPVKLRYHRRQPLSVGTVDTAVVALAPRESLSASAASHSDRTGLNSFPSTIVAFTATIVALE
jgi:hypothetical protein